MTLRVPRRGSFQDVQIESAAPDLDRRNKGVFVSVGGPRPGRVIYGTYLVGCDRPGPARDGHVQPQRQIGGSLENARASRDPHAGHVPGRPRPAGYRRYTCWWKTLPT